MERKAGLCRKTQCHAMPSPLGNVYIYSSGGRPLRIAISIQPKEVPVSASSPPALISAIMEAIGDFFAAGEVSGEVTRTLLADPRLSSFQKRAYSVVTTIPRGSTLSYGEVARRAGFPRAARAVGAAMRHNPFPILIPCHRVIRSDGSLGGYSGTPNAKWQLLKWEGLEIDHSSREPRLKREPDRKSGFSPWHP